MMKINQYVQNYQKHGLWEDYYNNGQLDYKGNFINGKKYGPWVSYFSDGQLFFKGYYNNNTEVGYWEFNNNVKKFYLR